MLRKGVRVRDAQALLQELPPALVAELDPGAADAVERVRVGLVKPPLAREAERLLTPGDGLRGLAGEDVQLRPGGPRHGQTARAQACCRLRSASPCETFLVALSRWPDSNRRPTVYEGIPSDCAEAHRGELIETGEGDASGSTRALADSRDGDVGGGADFPDAILTALLRALAVWMATRDPAALRRELIAILAALG
jgi:hypothetical protein